MYFVFGLVWFTCFVLGMCVEGDISDWIHAIADGHGGIDVDIGWRVAGRGGTGRGIWMANCGG